MEQSLKLIDYMALAPILITFGMALILILLESLTDKKIGHYAPILTALALITAIFVAWPSNISDNPLLTTWLRFDEFAHFFTLFFLFLSLAIALLSASFLQYFVISQGEYFFFLLSALVGMLLISASADFLTLFIGIELLSLSSYLLCGYMKQWRFSAEASVKYFLMGAFATAFLLYGIALIYGAVGTTKFDGLSEHYRTLAAHNQRILFLSGIALISLGLCFKAAIVPFHMWAPDAYSGAATPVIAFMAVGTKAAAFVALARVFLVELAGFDALWQQAMAWLAYPTLIYANIVALRQNRLRRFLAYSGIAQAGFMLLALAAGTSEAISALSFYLIVYAFAMIAILAVLTELDRDEKGLMLTDLNGLAYRSPWRAAILVLALLTLSGIPPTAGFFAKFYLFKVAFKANYHLLVVVALCLSVFAAYYYLRIVSLIFSKYTQTKIIYSATLPLVFVGVLAFSTLLWLALDPQWVMGLFQNSV